MIRGDKNAVPMLGASVLAMLLGAGLGCAERQVQRDFVAPMEAAHGRDAWLSKPAVAFDLDLNLGLLRPLHARFTMETGGKRVRADVQDGPTLGYDGAHIWISPASAEFEDARYHLMAWPWFFANPFILQGEGVHLQPMDPLPLWGVEHAAVRLTVRDEDMSPDDWFVLYEDPKRRLLVAVAYLMTYGESDGYSEVTPQAVTFKNFVTVDGVTLASMWEFWSWDKKQGPFGDFLGVARVSNIRFAEPPAGTFDRPADARVIDGPPE